MRIFIGVSLSVETKRPVEKLLKKLTRKHWPVSWEKLERLHFTLAFLGEMEETETLKKVVRKVGGNQAPFTVTIKSLGCFPDYLEPHIIWLGVKGDLKSLAALRKQLTRQLREAGFSLDTKPFMPHLTLGRIKQVRFWERKEIGRQLKGLRQLEIEAEWPVTEITIFESQTLPIGSVYRVKAHIPLEG